MEFTQRQNIKYIASLLLLAVITQAIYTALYVAAKDVPRQWLWGFEGVLFVVLADVAGSALVQSKKYSLGFSAILVSAIFNVIQVGIGLTQFGAFREAAQAVDGLAPATGSVVALSFFIYNAAKILLGLAAVIFGMTVLKYGLKLLGGATVLLGGIAIATNTIVVLFGRIDGVPSGATGVVATLLLAICLFKLQTED